MRDFAQEQNAAQKPAPSSFAGPGMLAAWQPHRQQAAPRATENMATGTMSPPSAASLHFDFARIPLTAPVQRKPAVSSPGDAFEQEADNVAEKVTRMAEPLSIGQAVPPIQRKCAKCDDDEKKPIHAKSAPSAHTGAALDSDAAVRAAERGGAPLSPEVRSYFEPRFGYDFGRVRVHADGEATSAARAVQARAYTVGRNIVFGSGEYAPATTEGKQLLAHELVHVVQQGAVQGKPDARFLNSGPSLLIQRACEPAAIQAAVKGRFTSLELGDPGVKGTLVRFRVGCDEFLTSADEKALHAFAKLPPRTRIIIHGFASEEGPPMFNLLLSQARAVKVKDILSGLLDPAQIDRVIMHGAVPGARPDRRSVIIETKEALPTISKTLSIVSWISEKGLPDFSKSDIALSPPTIRVIEAVCMALKCTANPAPPAKLPMSAVAAFLASKQYRAFQSYTISYIPSTTARGVFVPMQVVGFTAPSSCSEVPPSTFKLGEASPLNHSTSDMGKTDPQADALMKFRVSSAEESEAIEEATSFPGYLLFSASMLRHVPWVWTHTSLRLDASTGLLNWFVQGSAFPTHTIYLDGLRVAEISQGPCGVVVSDRFRTADQPRQTTGEEAKQASVPVGSQAETVDPGGTASGKG